jgi:hypothetical protein
MLRIPHCLDNRLTDGGEAVSLTHSPRSAPAYKFLFLSRVDIFVVYARHKLHNLYSSPSIIRIIKSRRMRWAGHVARYGGEDERV